jgi:hypothetical protein
VSDLKQRYSEEELEKLVRAALPVWQSYADYDFGFFQHIPKTGKVKLDKQCIRGV